jgi:membrane associated rhomboid family serine protease
MRQSIFKELWDKMVNSGSRANLFIGINTIVFLVIGLLGLVALFTRDYTIKSWALNQLSATADLNALVYKPWSVVTYMFTHEELLHFFFNMLVLYWFGRIFEDFLNARQFTFTYLAGGLFGGILYIALYNILPLFRDSLVGSQMIGASGSAMAIVVATATLVPDYVVRLFLFGDVRLKYLAIIYIALDILSMAGPNAGGSIAHLGGALFGFIFIKQLQAGSDWSKIFQKRQRLKVVKRSVNVAPTTSSRIPEQELIDRILDKISQSGYQSLTEQEKEQLFKASNKE